VVPRSRDSLLTNAIKYSLALHPCDAPLMRQARHSAQPALALVRRPGPPALASPRYRDAHIAGSTCSALDRLLPCAPVPGPASLPTAAHARESSPGCKARGRNLCNLHQALCHLPLDLQGGAKGHRHNLALCA